MPAAFISFVTLLDTNGSPLSGGKLWIGPKHENPESKALPVFWDAELTQLAEQPVPIENGSPSRNGKTAVLYLNSDHSVIVRNRRGWLTAAEVSSVPRVTGSGHLSASVPSRLVGYVATTTRNSTVGAKKETISAKQLGVVGDWNGVRGTDNSALIAQGLRLSAATSRAFVIDLQNVGASCIEVHSIDGWKLIIDGSIVSISKKPKGGPMDARSSHGGQLPLFKIANCNRWEMSGSKLDPRYREALWIMNCASFENTVEVQGSGLNDNLDACLYRHCKQFKIGGKVFAATTKPDNGYLSWANAVTFWDCTDFVVLSNFSASFNGGNGIYIGSNCVDFQVEPGAACLSNAMSGIQLAWSSFGKFPRRFKIGAMRLQGNGADGLDVNNTDPKTTIARLDGEFEGHIGERNGFSRSGKVTPDGSGIGTFANVSHFTIKGAVSTNSARAGFYARNCSDFSVSGTIRKTSQEGNVGEGVYLEDCRHYRLNIDVVTRPDQEALKLYGHHVDGRISGNFEGIVAIAAESQKTSYTDVALTSCRITTTETVSGTVAIFDSHISSSKNALLAFKEVKNTNTTSKNGIAIVYGASGVKISGGRHVGGNSGTYCNGFDNCSLTDGAYAAGQSGPASQWLKASGSVITDCTFEAQGTSNALRIESDCRRTTVYGNTSRGIDHLEGDYVRNG